MLLLGRLWNSLGWKIGLSSILFDDAHVQAGQGTVAYEILEDNRSGVHQFRLGLGTSRRRWSHRRSIHLH